MPTIHLLINGDVQGVFYRATAKKIADKLNIKGWVKNKKDGSVEAMATGTQQQLQEFITWCKQGPEKAAVDDVVVTEEKETAFDEFVIARLS